ncbi:MAG: RNA-directed DNA polymerase [Actinomycetota bacterium]
MLSGFFGREEQPSVTFESIPKPSGVRLITHLSGPIATEYRHAVGSTVPWVEGSLTAAVAAERVTSRLGPDGPRIVPMDLGDARSRCRARARALSTSRPGPVILADVRACYGSIAPAVAERCVRALGLLDAAARIRDVLERFAELGVPGLPIGPRASVVLANTVLSRIDREIEAAGALHVRWVDDLAIFAGDRDPESVLLRVVEALDRLGLSLAEDKSAIGPLTATRFGRSLARPSVAHVEGSLG